jgi:hypothetical protein
MAVNMKVLGETGKWMASEFSPAKMEKVEKVNGSKENVSLGFETLFNDYLQFQSN